MQTRCCRVDAGNGYGVVATKLKKGSSCLCMGCASGGERAAGSALRKDGGLDRLPFLWRQKEKIQNSLHGKGAQACHCGLLLRHGPCNTVGAVTALELDWGQAGLQGELQSHSRCANPLLLSLSRQCQRWDSTSTSVHCCPHSRACAVSGLRSFLILVIWSCSQRSSVASLGTFPFSSKAGGQLGNVSR